MTRFRNVNGVDIQFTPEEEIARDEEERVNKIYDAAAREVAQRLVELEVKLTEDSITFTEMKELMRLRR